MNPEVDEIIHLMRQSKMDNIRSYLEKLVSERDERNSTISGIFLIQIRDMFQSTSTPKQS